MKWLQILLFDTNNPIQHYPFICTQSNGSVYCFSQAIEDIRSSLTEGLPFINVWYILFLAILVILTYMDCDKKQLKLKEERKYMNSSVEKNLFAFCLFFTQNKSWCS